MVKNIKIFSGLNLDEVEKQVNNWIGSTGYKIINVAAASGGYGIKIVILYDV